MSVPASFQTLFILTLSLTAAPLAGGDVRYFGLEVPRGAPQPFEPPLFKALARPPSISITGPAFSPDFRRFAFSLVDASNRDRVSVTVYESRRAGDEWSAPACAAVLTAGGYTAGEGVYSPDGRWFYFSSSRPPGAPGLAPRVFRASVEPDGFGAPEYVPLDPPSGGGTYYPRLVTGGGMAFTAPGPVGRDDLFIAMPRAAGYEVPRPVQGDFNTPQDDWDLVESHDGSLRFWASARPGGLGRTDIWYSRRVGDGRWSRARNLAAVNTTALETAPQLSPDDVVLFFLRSEKGVNRLYWVELASLEEMTHE